MSDRPLNVDLLLESGGGGAGRHVIDLFRGLVARGHRVRLIFSKLRADIGFEREIDSLPREDVIELPMRRSVGPRDFAAAARLTGMLHANRPDILHAHSTKAGIIGTLADLRGITRILTPHAYRGMDGTLSRWKRLIIQTAERQYTRGYDQVIAVSPSEFRYACQLGVPPAKVSYIPNGVDLVMWRPPAKRAPAADSPYTIGLVGRLTHQKNPTAFVEVLAKLQQRGDAVRGVVVGDGPLMEEMQARAESLGISDSLVFRGWLCGSDTLDGIDILVHSSHYESMPYGLMEAMAAEIPIAAVKNAGTEVLLAEAYGDLGESTDIDALVAQVVRLRRDASYASRRAEQAARTIAGLSLDHMVEATLQVYRRALADRQR